MWLLHLSPHFQMTWYITSGCLKEHSAPSFVCKGFCKQEVFLTALGCETLIFDVKFFAALLNKRGLFIPTKNSKEALTE